MIERTLYGPVEYLAPDTDLKAVLEIGGIKIPDVAFSTHVFLEEVEGGDLDGSIKTANHAGRFTVPDDVASLDGQRGTVRIDITEALRKAEEQRPNFHITFLTEVEATTTNRVFQFESVHIEHNVPGNSELDISADVMGGLATARKKPI